MRYLGFLDFPKTSEKHQNRQKTNRNDTKNTKRIYKYESYCKKVSFCVLKNRDLPKSGKPVCQKLIAGKISDSVNPNLPTELFPGKFLKKS